MFAGIHHRLTLGKAEDGRSPQNSEIVSLWVFNLGPIKPISLVCGWGPGAMIYP